jgi:ABC-type Fe3+/spermidine/putrescine transport system ATPase subunit
MLRTEPRQRQSSAGARTDAIEIENIGKVFRTRLGTVAVEALRDVSFAISPGQFVSFVGPSGCGKSTLLKLIGGLIEPTSGRITVGGVDVKGPRRDWSGLRTASVPIPPSCRAACSSAPRSAGFWLSIHRSS